MVRDTQQPAENGCLSGCLFSYVPWALLITGILGGLAVFYLSSRATPGDRFYPLKRFFEDTRLSLTNVPSQRVELEKIFDDERIKEIDALMQVSQGANVDFSAGLIEADENGEWLVGDYKVLVRPETEYVGRVYRGIYVTVYGTLQEDGIIEANRIQPREFVFEDKLNSVASNQWLVDGVNVFVAHDSEIHGSPKMGSEVRIRAFRLLNDQLVARLIEEIGQK